MVMADPDLIDAPVGLHHSQVYAVSLQPSLSSSAVPTIGMDLLGAGGKIGHLSVVLVPPTTVSRNVTDRLI